MTLTPAQIAAVSAALPGWTHHIEGRYESWNAAGNASVVWEITPITHHVHMAVHCSWDASDWPRVRALGDQAAAAAAMLEGFAKEGKT